MKHDPIEKLLQSLDTQITPPRGLQEKVYTHVVASVFPIPHDMTPLEQFFTIQPLRAAGIIAIAVSGSLWAMLGGNITVLLGGLIG